MRVVTANIGKYKTKSGIRYRVRITNRRLRREANPCNKAGFSKYRSNHVQFALAVIGHGYPF